MAQNYSLFGDVIDSQHYQFDGNFQESSIPHTLSMLNYILYTALLQHQTIMTVISKMCYLFAISSYSFL